MRYYITRHALTRYREHQPEAEEEDLLSVLTWGQDVSPDIVRVVCGRYHVDSESTYRLAPHYRGIFVLRSGGVITYLRLAPSQEEFFRSQYGVATPPAPAETPPSPDEPPVVPHVSSTQRQAEHWERRCREHEKQRLRDVAARYGYQS